MFVWFVPSASIAKICPPVRPSARRVAAALEGDHRAVRRPTRGAVLVAGGWGRELCLAAPVGVHGPDLVDRPHPADEGDLLTVRRERGPVVDGAVLRDVDLPGARLAHHPDLRLRVALPAAAALVGDPLPVSRPARTAIGRTLLAQPRRPCPVGLHGEDLREALVEAREGDLPVAPGEARGGRRCRNERRDHYERDRGQPGSLAERSHLGPPSVASSTPLVVRAGPIPSVGRYRLRP